MCGNGNSYVYIDLFKTKLNNINFSTLSKKVSDINFGIGSDGLITISPSKYADCKMRIFNKDGSEGKMCGNGIRCVARYFYENVKKKSKITIETKSGIKKIYVKPTKNDYLIKVNMGKPILKSKKIPVLLKKKKILNLNYNFNNLNLRISCVSMGNPHTIIFVDNVDAIDIKKISQQIQKSKIFPNNTNVEYVQILSKNHIKMRVFEIGSEETLSCGTGACASVVAGILNNLLDKKEKIKVETRGGILNVYWKKNVFLEGFTKVICYGKFKIKQ